MQLPPPPEETIYTPKRRIKKWLVPVVVTILMIGCLVGAIEITPSLAAKFADNVLRPLIGNKATVTFESGMLNLSDHLKRVFYGSVARPSAKIFNPEPVAAATTTPAQATPDPRVLNLAPLHAFQSTYPKLTGEGEWTGVALPQFNGQTWMARTFVRPDPERSYAIVAVVAMDMHHLKLHAVAGTIYPGAALGHPGPGIIPATTQQSRGLVAAFNGGFQYIDGHYGMSVGPTTYVPMVKGLGTLTLYQAGLPHLSSYSGPSADTASIEAMRQNGPLIVDNGGVTPNAINGGYALWGRTTTNSMYTWRSGVGITANGNLLYAVGPSLTAKTLGQALRDAGAVEAMQLDINAYWVRFVTFRPATPNGYQYESILNTLANGGYDYLHGYSKDFFYVTAND